MLQSIVSKVIATPAVVETLELLALSLIIDGTRSVMSMYVDKTARRRAERIIRNMQNRR